MDAIKVMSGVGQVVGLALAGGAAAAYVTHQVRQPGWEGDARDTLGILAPVGLGGMAAGGLGILGATALDKVVANSAHSAAVRGAASFGSGLGGGMAAIGVLAGIALVAGGPITLVGAAVDAK